MQESEGEPDEQNFNCRGQNQPMETDQIANWPRSVTSAVWMSTWLTGWLDQHQSVSVSLSVMSDSLRPNGLQPTRVLCPWDSPGKNTGVTCHFLLQEIFPIHRSNPSLPHCRQNLYHLCHQSPTSEGIYFARQYQNLPLLLLPWNVRSMNQGKLEVVIQDIARVNVDILRISELKWTGMDEFNSVTLIHL